MKSNKLIILCCIIIILIVGICSSFLIFGNSTKLTIISDEKLANGDTFSVKLSSGDVVLANQAVTIILINDNQEENVQNVVTNSEGIAGFTLSGVDDGDYSVVCRYGGDSKYPGCELTSTVTIKTEVAQIQSAEPSRSLNGLTDYDKRYDITSDGWDPAAHETYTEELDGGYIKIHYDDYYFRIYDSQGNLVNYGTGG